MSPTAVHHRRTMRGISLILVALFTFSAKDTLAAPLYWVTPLQAVLMLVMGLLAVNWQHMRRWSDASDQSGTH